jgi:ABC-type antimicrobial peptide transport system permease subunit
MRQVFRVAWYRFHASFGRRWGGYLTIVLLVGFLGGLAMGAVASARRTQSAYPTYLAGSHASELEVAVYLDDGNDPAQSYSRQLSDEIAHLRDVTQVGTDLELFVSPLNSKGLPANATAIADGQVMPIGSLNGLFFDQDRPAVAQGRLPDPHRISEFMTTVSAARLLGWHVGEKFHMGSFTLAQISSSGFGIPTVRPARQFTTTLVGTVVLNTQVVSDDIDRYPTDAIFTPALTKSLFAAGEAVYPSYQLRLLHGDRDVPVVEREIIDLLPKDTLYNFHVTSVSVGDVERATKPESIAMAVFGAIAGLATLVIGGQAVGRRIVSRREESGVLRALGATPSMTIADSLIGTTGAVLVGVVVAMVFAILLSPLAPLGAVRQIDPSPGFAVDWTVVGLGSALLVIGLGTITMIAAFRAAPHRLPEIGDTPAVRSRIAGTAAASGMPVSAVAGIRFALERARGTVPVRSALAGSAVAVLLVVATLTFGSGLNTLVTHPSLYGWNWNYAIVEEGGGQVPPYAQHLLDRSPVVAAWTGFSYADAEIDGQTVPILRVTADSPFSPPILSGHRVTGDRQIVLGAATLAQLHKKVGDIVVLSYGARKDAPAYIPPTRLRVVGAATLPAIGDAGVLHPSMGTGGIVEDDAAPAAFRRTLTNPDPNLNGPTLAAVRLRNGVSPAAGRAALELIASATTKAVASDPNAGGTFGVLAVQRPAEIVNYRSTGTTPTLLAVGLAAGAVAALGLTLAASVRRRRRDLALLKTLGFTRRQLLATVVWQASVAAVVGIAVGVPLGIVSGRWLWTLFARAIFAVPSPSVPAGQIIVVAAGALVLAILVAIPPGLFSARTRTSLLLREE